MSKYVLECNENQLRLIDQSLRSLARIMLGQFKIGFEEAGILRFGKNDWDAAGWTKAQAEWLGELECNRELNTMINHTENSEIVWDMHQVIRNIFWKENPNRSNMTVDSSVCQMGKENLVKVERK